MLKKNFHYLQPEHAYHFSSDALLLADFTYKLIEENIFLKKRHVQAPFYFLDLGCGCGVIGLEILQKIQKNYPKKLPEVFILGIDKEEELVKYALHNAKNFGFATQYHALTFEVSHASLKTDSFFHRSRIEKLFNVPEHKVTEHKEMTQKNSTITDMHITESPIKTSIPHNDTNIFCTKEKNKGISHNPRIFDIVFTNPPWYLEARGKGTKNHLRKSALFGEEELALFFLFADKHIKTAGILSMIAKPNCFLRTLDAMPQPFRPIQMQNVYAHQHSQTATFFLLEAKRNSNTDIIFTKPLFLEER